MNDLNRAVDYIQNNYAFIKGSNSARIGSSRDEINKAVHFWKSRLINTCFTEEKFKSWLEKEYPLHHQNIPYYFIAKFPVTNEKYSEFLSNQVNNKEEIPTSLMRKEPPDHPVWGVSIEMCERFCNFVRNKLEKSGLEVEVDLPTESQWEYAARGETNNLYPYGNHFDPEKANTVESGIGKTTHVRRYQKHPSPFGVYDLAGNVEEWTRSIYQPYPGGQLIHDDLSDHHQTYHVLRGGSFVFGGDVSRCARRHGPHPDPEFLYAGFRPVINMSPKNNWPTAFKQLINSYLQNGSLRDTKAAKNHT